MNDLLTLSTAPGVIVGFAAFGVGALSALYNSYSDADERAAMRLLLILPVLIVSLGVVGFFLPTFTRGWAGAVRIYIVVQVALILCSEHLVSGVADPGAGRTGQDAGFIFALAFGLGASVIANAICISVLLRAQRAALASRYQEHGQYETLLTAFTTISVSVAQFVITGGVSMIRGVVAPIFRRRSCDGGGLR